MRVIETNPVALNAHIGTASVLASCTTAHAPGTTEKWYGIRYSTRHGDADGHFRIASVAHAVDLSA